MFDRQIPILENGLTGTRKRWIFFVFIAIGEFSDVKESDV